MELVDLLSVTVEQEQQTFVEGKLLVSLSSCKWVDIKNISPHQKPLSFSYGIVHYSSTPLVWFD